MKEVRLTKDKIDLDVKQIMETNNRQERRIKVLEIQESAAAYYRNKQASRALEYIAVGLDIEENNEVLLAMKVLALMSIETWGDALVTCKKLYQINPNDDSNTSNYMELALFCYAFQDYMEIYSKHMAKIDRLHLGELSVYFECLEKIQKEDVAACVAKIKQYLSDQTEQRKRAGTWSFQEALAFFGSKPQSPRAV